MYSKRKNKFGGGATPRESHYVDRAFQEARTARITECKPLQHPSARRARFRRRRSRGRSDTKRYARRGPHRPDLSDPIFRSGLGVLLRQELKTATRYMARQAQASSHPSPVQASSLKQTSVPDTLTCAMSSDSTVSSSSCSNCSPSKPKMDPKLESKMDPVLGSKMDSEWGSQKHERTATKAILKGSMMEPKIESKSEVKKESLKEAYCSPRSHHSPTEYHSSLPQCPHPTVFMATCEQKHWLFTDSASDSDTGSDSEWVPDSDSEQAPTVLKEAPKPLSKPITPSPMKEAPKSKARRWLFADDSDSDFEDTPPQPSAYLSACLLNQKNSYSLIWDSGASMCVTGDKMDFIDKIQPVYGSQIQGISDGLCIEGFGHVCWSVLDTKGQLRHLKLPAYYIPTIKQRLLSTSVFREIYQKNRIYIDVDSWSIEPNAEDPSQGGINGPNYSTPCFGSNQLFYSPGISNCFYS